MVRTAGLEIDRHIIPNLGTLKVREVTRADVSGLFTKMKKTPVTANRVLSCLRQMFNMAAERAGPRALRRLGARLRRDGSGRGKTRHPWQSRPVVGVKQPPP